MKEMNIYITGVGGQGIGMLSEIIARAADYAGYKIKAVDTHGLAQRGGTVTSEIRIGYDIYSPIIEKGNADLVIALEKHEALRGMNEMLKDGGTLLWYDTSWQPLPVRLGETKEVSEKDIEFEALSRKIRNIKVLDKDLKESRMQNIVLLAHLIKNRLIEKIDENICKKVMKELMNDKIYSMNEEIMEKTT